MVRQSIWIQRCGCTATKEHSGNDSESATGKVRVEQGGCQCEVTRGYGDKAVAKGGNDDNGDGDSGDGSNTYECL